MIDKNFLATPRKWLSKLGPARVAALGLLAFALGCGGGGGIPAFGDANGYKPFFVYTANYGSNDISEFSGDADGNLLFIGKVPSLVEPQGLITDGRFLFVICGGNNISVYNIGKDGKLYFNSKIDTDTSKDADPTALAFGYPDANSYPNTLYAASENGSVQAFSIGTNGTLTFKYEDQNIGTPLAIASQFQGKGLPTNLFTTELIGNAIALDQDTGSAMREPSPSYVKVDSGIADYDFSIKVDPNQNKLYVLDATKNLLNEFAETTGASTVSLKPSTSLAIPAGATKMDLDNGDGELLVLNPTAHTLSDFHPDTPSFNNKLAAIPGDVVSTTGTPTGLLAGYFNGAMSDHSLAFVTTKEGNLYVYGHSGGFTLKALNYISTQGTNPVAVAATDNIGDPTYVSPTIVQTTLPDGTPGTAYSSPLSLENGDGTQGAWQVTAGSLPPGLGLSDVGVPSGYGVLITGTPTTGGTYTFTLTASQGFVTTSRQYTVHVTPPLHINTTSLASGQVGTPYSQNLTVSGGDGTQTAAWTVTAGSLPPGLSLKTNPSNEILTGTPTTAGTFNFTLKAAQGTNASTVGYSLTIAAGVSGTTMRVLNAATDANDSSDTVTIGGHAFASQAFGSMSSAISTTLANSQPYSVLNGASETWTGNTFVSAGDRNIYVTLGPTAADRKLAFLFNQPSVPGTVNGGITFMNGIPARLTSMVDVHLLDSTGTEIAHQETLAYGSFTSFSFTPGSYQVTVTPTGSTTVLATSTLTPIAAGQNFIEVAVAPASGAGGDGVIEAQEN